MTRPIVPISRREQRTRRLCPRVAVQRIAGAVVRQESERVVGRPAVGGRVGDPDLSVMIQGRSALVDGDFDSLPVLQRLRKDVLLADGGGRVESGDAVGLDAVFHARPDEVVLRVDDENSTVNAPVGGQLAEVFV